MKPRRFLRSRLPVACAIGASVFAVVLALRLAGLLQSLELGAYDRFLRWRGWTQRQNPPIALIQIREEDIRRFGHPICDGLLADAVATLLEARPRAIGVDLYRDTPVPCDGEEANGYQTLATLVRANNRIVMTTKFSTPWESGTPAPSFLEGSEQVGFADVPLDPKGVVRRALLMMWKEGEQHLSFALQLARRYLAPEGIAIEGDPESPAHLRLGATTIPPLGENTGSYVGADTGGYQFMLDYASGPNTFAAIPFGELLARDVAIDQLRDKVVILGTTAPSVKDHFFTPFSGTLPEAWQNYGIEIHAHAVDQLLRYAHGRSAPLRDLGGASEALLILLWSALGVGLGFGARRAPLAALGVAALLVGGAYGLFLGGWWLPIVPSGLAAAGSASLVAMYLAGIERVERREVTRLFSRFLRPKVASHIWQMRDQFMDGERLGRPRSRWLPVTTLMADLENYTGIAEEMDPLVVMDWVNEFTATMAEVIDDHEGVVDDYAGDGIKASFGFPAPRSTEEEERRDARNAVSCALAMGRKMEELNRHWRERELPTVRLRVGIMTGAAVAGVLGSDQSLKYTTVGDAVNTAARLESLDKELFRANESGDAWRILIGEGTLRFVKDAFRTVDLGEHLLKGRAEKLRVFQVLGFVDPAEDGASGEVRA